MEADGRVFSLGGSARVPATVWVADDSGTRDDNRKSPRSIASGTRRRGIGATTARGQGEPAAAEHRQQCAATTSGRHQHIRAFGKSQYARTGTVCTTGATGSSFAPASRDLERTAGQPPGHDAAHPQRAAAAATAEKPGARG